MGDDKFTLGDTGDAVAKFYRLTDMMLASISDEGLDNLYDDSLSEEYCVKPDFVARDIIDDELLLVFIAEPGKLPEVIGRISFAVATLCTPARVNRAIVIAQNDRDRYMIETILSFLDSIDDFCEVHVITYEEYNEM